MNSLTNVIIVLAVFAASVEAFHLSSTRLPSSHLEMKFKVAVVGGGPSGACAAEILAQV